jgi:hypothetical protein
MGFRSLAGCGMNFSLPIEWGIQVLEKGADGSVGAYTRGTWRGRGGGTQRLDQAR